MVDQTRKFGGIHMYIRMYILYAIQHWSLMSASFLVEVNTHIYIHTYVRT